MLTNHYERVTAVPGVEDVWQVHRSLFDGARNTPEERIANLTDSDACQGHWLKLAIRPDGAFTVTNGRTGLSKAYKAR